MNATPLLQTEPRPEAMSDVPGVCELPLTRAVVQYRDVHEMDLAGGRIQDIGLALVLEGRFASSAEAIDLGSASVKLLDLSAELVVLDWVYEPTLEHAHRLVRAVASRAERGEERAESHREMERFCFRLAMTVLERVGYGPLTRPSLLRIGFRDVCRDLDLHEGTSVRIAMAAGRVVRAHLDYDGNALVFRTAGTAPDPGLEDALADAFPTGALHRLVPSTAGRGGGYQVRFPLPLGIDEAREELASIRTGLARLVSRFEPERFRALERVVDTFGRRETLARLHFRPPRLRYARVARPSTTVH
ncbi:MAG: hypothetical protein PVI57_22695 [Gemmatimonadota bacterium]|jgi:hypothetical protein